MHGQPNIKRDKILKIILKDQINYTGRVVKSV